MVVRRGESAFELEVVHRDGLVVFVVDLGLERGSLTVALGDEVVGLGALDALDVVAALLGAPTRG